MLIMLACLVFTPAFAFQTDAPVMPHASPESHALLNFFADSYGKNIISGQHDGWRMTNGMTEELHYIQQTTGTLPALLELDVSDYTMSGHDANHRVANYVKGWSQERHGIAALCWHWHAPMNGRSFYVKETTFDVARAVTPGTPEYDAVEQDLDSVADELTILRDAHVPVVWRPLHEANGRWFWWGAGGPEPFKKLWRMMFENFSAKHHLDNLIWVFTAGAETDLAAWYPGDAYVDIVGADHYPMDGNHNPAREIFDELTRMTRGQKMICLGENGPIPDPVQAQHDHADWLFFNTWSGSILFEKTTAAQLNDYYHYPGVLTLTNLPDFKHYPAKPAGKAVALKFLGAPGDVAVKGHWRMPITVMVVDKAGQTVREGSCEVTLSLKNAGKARLSGTLVATSTNGVAAFPDIEIDALAKDCRFKASAEKLSGAASERFSVGPGNGLESESWTGKKEFSEPPDAKAVLNTALELPVQTATNYSGRICGWLIAPESGEYHFTMAEGGQSELWLATDESATNAVKIVAVTGSTPYRKWPHVHEADSAAVTLVAGRKYYIEIRQWQRKGSTQLHVRWQLPDGGEERPIPAFRFEFPAS